MRRQLPFILGLILSLTAITALVSPLSAAPATAEPSAAERMKADAFSTGYGANITKTQEVQDIRLTVARIIRNIMGLLGILTVCLMLYAGFLYMTASGNEEQIGKAKKMMINAAIGLAIIMSAFAIAEFTIRAITNQEATAGGWKASGTIQVNPFK